MEVLEANITIKHASTKIGIKIQLGKKRRQLFFILVSIAETRRFQLLGIRCYVVTTIEQCQAVIRNDTIDTDEVQ